MQRRFLALITLAFIAAACTPGGGTPPPTTFPPGATAPVISSFTSPTGTVASPALATLQWSVADPQGTALTCTIDGNGDGTVDLTVPNCQGTGSRNVTLPAVGTYVAQLTVSDGTETAQASTSVIVIPGGPPESYDIVVRPVGSLDPAVQAAFDTAAARWSQILVRGVPDLTPSPVIPAGECLAGSAPISFVDDLIIDVRVTPIDVIGGVLGSAGPCWTGTDGLSRVGVMEFDSADVADLVSSGQFSQVVLHEMAHVLGLGTLWTDFPSLISGFNNFTGTDPRFVGARAVAEWSALGRTGGVPAEADGGPGTAYVHWDEAALNNELMTGYLNSGANPLSRLTIASMGDLGYRVDVTQADAYVPPGGLFRFGADAPDRPPAARMVLIRPHGSG